MSERILLLHPGEMGSSIGAALRSNGHAVSWVHAGRSGRTRERAEKTELERVDSLAEALGRADHVVSICPPDAALGLARQVRDGGFQGGYVDANAVSPATAREIHAVVGDAYVDGGIIGPPAWKEGTTRLYLSGPRAGHAAGWFAGSLVDAHAIEGGPGAASALKMCYAAFTKGSSALILAIRALAEREGVTPALVGEWERSQPGLRQRSEVTARATSRKAWRFEGEMHEIAATFEDAELPGGFHAAAAEIYRRMSDLKDLENDADLAVVIARLLREPGAPRRDR